MTHGFVTFVVGVTLLGTFSVLFSIFFPDETFGTVFTGGSTLAFTVFTEGDSALSFTVFTGGGSTLAFTAFTGGSTLAFTVSMAFSIFFFEGTVGVVLAGPSI